MRGIAGLEIVSMECGDVKVLDFDMSKKTAFETLRNAEEASRIQIQTEIFEFREIFTELCHSLQEYVKGLLDLDFEAIVSDRVDNPHIRIALARRDEKSHFSIRLRYCVGYEDFTDDLILLPITASVTGKALMDGKPAIYVEEGFPRDARLPGPENRQRRRLIWPDMKWLAAVPVAIDDSASGDYVDYVVVVDGNIPLDENHPEFKEFGNLLAKTAKETAESISEKLNDTLKQARDET
jgi:hypothetical protein